VDCGLILEKGRGLNEKVAGIFSFLNYFIIGNGMGSVHGSWTSVGRGPWCTGHHGWPWSLPELGLAAAPGHDVLLRGGEKKEGTMGSLLWLVPRLGR
jgi:hypothetical protein